MNVVNRWVDRSCSAVVSFAVIGVNLYYVRPNADSVAVAVMTSACCVTAALSKVLKRVIGQARPSGAPKLSPGMPSNHATTLSFLAVMACAGLWRAHRVNGGGEGAVTNLYLTQAAIMAYSLYATCLRVWCGHHTYPQVVVGYTFGTACACAVLGMNYAGYTGSRAGGRVDELPHGMKVALLVGSLFTGFFAFRSILRGSPLFEKNVKRAGDPAL